jgi:hypothetical protein
MNAVNRDVGIFNLCTFDVTSQDIVSEAYERQDVPELGLYPGPAQKIKLSHYERILKLI